MWGDLFNSVDLLKKGMDAGWLRNEVISNNIANEDTVGFKASEVEFENLFAQSLQGKGSGGSLGLTVTDARHISNGGSSATDSSGAGAVEPVVTTDEKDSLRYDGNNVDVEHEMAEMAKNTIEYYTLVGKVNSEFKKLSAAINVT